MILKEWLILSYWRKSKYNRRAFYDNWGKKRNYSFFRTYFKNINCFYSNNWFKKKFLTTIVLDENYEEKPNNNFEFKAKFSNATKDASCIIPKQFNDTILVNCTIYNINDIDPYNQGFEYGNSSDHIKFVYYSFNASTLLKANEIIPNSNVITETDKSKNILSKDNNNNKNEDLPKYNYFRKNTKKSLSAGGIIAIVVCSVITLAAIIGIGIISKKSAAPATQANSNFENSEIRKIWI